MTDAPVTPPDGQPRWMVYMKLDDLLGRQMEGNPKDHDLEGIGDSMDRWGYTTPCELDERTGGLIAGHGRIETAVRLRDSGDPPPNGVVITDGEWALPVVRGWSSTDDAEARAYAVANSRLPQAGGWKAELLADWMEGLDLLGTGFTAASLDDVFAGLNTTPIELPDQGTDAAHADLPPARVAPPPPPRSAQGLKDQVLTYTVERHREFSDLVAQLKRAYGTDIVPDVVLQALQDALDAHRAVAQGGAS